MNSFFTNRIRGTHPYRLYYKMALSRAPLLMNSQGTIPDTYGVRFFYSLIAPFYHPDTESISNLDQKKALVVYKKLTHKGL